MTVWTRLCVLCHSPLWTDYLHGHGLIPHNEVEWSPDSNELDHTTLFDADRNSPTIVAVRKEISRFLPAVVRHVRACSLLYDTGDFRPVGASADVGNLHPTGGEEIKSQDRDWNRSMVPFEDGDVNLVIPLHDACWDVFWARARRLFLLPPRSGRRLLNLPPPPDFFWDLRDAPDADDDDDDPTAAERTARRRFFAWMCSGWLYLELTDGFFPILWLPLPDCPFFSALSGTVDDSLVGNAWVLVDPSRSALPDPSAFVIPTAVPVLAESSAAVAAAAAAAVAASVSSPPRPPPPSLATMWMLPLEVLLRITAFLGVRHLLEVESLCRASRSAILCDPITRSSIWKSQCRRRDWLPLTMPVDLGPDQIIDWRAYFAACCHHPSARNRYRVLRCAKTVISNIKLGTPGGGDPLTLRPNKTLGLHAFVRHR